MNVRKAMPLVVDVPTAAEDRPPWVKVGIIAALGFVIGVAWPRLAGVRLGPTVPVESAPSAVSARADGPPQGSAPTAATAAPASAPVPPAASAVPLPVSAAAAEIPSVTVNRGVILSCKTEEGESQKGVTACGPVVGFDAIAQPRLRKLAACPAAAWASGKLSVVFNIDFPMNKVSVEIGKSSTVANVDGFASCVRPVFQGVSLGALDHQNPRYAIFYSVLFGPKDAVAAGSTATVAPSQGSTSGPVAVGTGPATASPVPTDDSTAQVVWEVAIVRDAPRTGQVLARLQRGTKVSLGTSQDGWYRVKYGSDLSSDGWVYRGAIGR